MPNKVFTVRYRGKSVEAEYLDTLPTVSTELPFPSHTNTLLGFDTETYVTNKAHTALDPVNANVRLVQLYYPVENKIKVFDYKKILESKNRHTDNFFHGIFSLWPVTGHYLAFDLQFLLKYGWEPKDANCTFLLAKLIMHSAMDVDQPAGLKDLAKGLLGVDLSKESQVTDWSKELVFQQIEYAAYDAIVAYDLYQTLKTRADALGLTKVYNLYKQANVAVARMKLKGIKLDTQYYTELIKKWRGELIQAREELSEVLKGVNINSARSIAGWLRNNLPADIIEIWPRSEKSNELSISADVTALFAHLPFVAPLHKYQKIKKLTSTYGIKFLKSVHEKDGRIHANHSIAGARTGRMSCSSPNLQNLPRDEDVRKAFIPERGNVFICADYSQIELRVAAELSHDPVMRGAYVEGRDLHKITAANILGITEAEVTKEQRQHGKAFNFGLLYGMGADTLVKYAKVNYGVNVSSEDSKDLIKKHWELYETYKKYKYVTSDKAQQTLETATVLGKRRRLTPDNYFGASLNTPVQGSAAEVMLLAMVYCDRKFREFELDAWIVNVIHDELTVECSKAHLKQAYAVLLKSMKAAWNRLFPGAPDKDLVSAGYGKSWGEAKV